MKIVLSNIALDTPHGSEVWTWTVARELLRRHHQVLIISAKFGKIARELERMGCYLICPIDIGEIKCDIAILNHADALSKRLQNLKPDKTILVTHGRHKPEMPYKGTRNVAVSREVANFWKSKKGIDFEIIPNPVAPEFFEIETRPSRLLWGNHRHKCPPWMLKREKVYHGFNTRPPLQIVQCYREANIVFGTGRWIYDGMAAGMNCIVTNSKRTLGHLIPANYQSFQKFNMTARHPAARTFNEKALDIILNNYDPERGAELKQIAMERHHVRVVVDKLLEV